MSRVRSVLFDLDGVLVDVSGSYRRAIDETVRHFTGSPPPEGSVQRLKDAGGYNDDWRLTAELVARTGEVVDFDELVAEFNRRYRGDRWDGFIASEPALVDLAHLDAVARRFGPLGLVTGRPRVEGAFTLDRFGWTDRFDVVVTMEDAEGRGKPDPYPLLLALERLGTDATEAVYVGDSVDDMACARAAGCLAVGFVPPYLDAVRHGAVLRSRGAHAVISDHGALIEAVSAAVPD